PTGLQDLQRIGLERARERRRTGGTRVSDGRTEDRAMAEMDAVEDAQSDRARPALRRDGRKTPDDLHAPFSPGARFRLSARTLRPRARQRSRRPLAPAQAPSAAA